MKTASWVLLTLLGVAALALSLVSAWVAYHGEFQIGPASLSGLEAAVPGVGLALRGARGTAAAFAFAYAVLLLSVVLGPYRRGDRWAFWAILASACALALVTGLRVPLLGIRPGAGTGTVFLVVAIVALLLDVRRLRAVR